MAAIQFCDLPIYRLSAARYGEELRQLTHKIIYDPPGTLFPTTEEMKAQSRANLLGHFQRKFGQWRFNEVVGYVRLSMVHRHVQGAYFGRRVMEPGLRHDAPIAREVRTRTKVFLSGFSLAPPQPIPPGSTNAQCLGIINEYVRACRRALPRRLFDDQWLREVGPFVGLERHGGRVRPITLQTHRGPQKEGQDMLGWSPQPDITIYERR
jgi:hypothetical protein